jgi:hypothetical protein
LRHSLVYFFPWLVEPKSSWSLPPEYLRYSNLDYYRVSFIWKGDRYQKYSDIVNQRTYLKEENTKTACVKVIRITCVYWKNKIGSGWSNPQINYFILKSSQVFTDIMKLPCLGFIVSETNCLMIIYIKLYLFIAKIHVKNYVLV